ncbi:MAG: phosphoribosylformylglycinamidine synthase subunit PurS [Promethearchaeota archaeon]
MIYSEFIIEVVLENKPAARDPVGETIKRDLLAKKGYDMVSNVRSGQYLRFYLSAENEKRAEEII